MSVYIRTKEGYLTLDGKTIPTSTSNRHYVKALKEIADSTSSVEEYTPPLDTRSYQDKRQSRYIAELSPEGTFSRYVGDTLDGLIDAVYGDTTKLDLLKVKIDQIKSDIPKI